MSGTPAFSIPIKNVLGKSRVAAGAGVAPSEFMAEDENGLLRFYHVDEFYRYKHVLSGYRPPMTTTMECIRSLWRLHNQTLNTFTMIMQLPLAVVYVFVGLYALHTPIEIHLAILFLMQYWVQSPFSIAFHTLQPRGLEIAKWWCRMDYGSIFVVAPIALYINTYYAFNALLTFRIVLWAISLTISIIFIMIVCSHFYDTFCMDRKFMFSGPAAQVILNLIPIFYSEYQDGWGKSGLYASLILINFILLTIVWLNHWPEKWYPITFDRTTHSHVLMHMSLLVTQGLQFGYLAAAAIEYSDSLENKF
jgi:adiponectin receptor